MIDSLIYSPLPTAGYAPPPPTQSTAARASSPLYSPLPARPLPCPSLARPWQRKGGGREEHLVCFFCSSSSSSSLVLLPPSRVFLFCIWVSFLLVALLLLLLLRSSFFSYSAASHYTRLARALSLSPRTPPPPSPTSLRFPGSGSAAGVAGAALPPLPSRPFWVGIGTRATSLFLLCSNPNTASEPPSGAFQDRRHPNPPSILILRWDAF